jgi:hypothetical protein
MPITKGGYELGSSANETNETAPPPLSKAFPGILSVRFTDLRPHALLRNCDRKIRAFDWRKRIEPPQLQLGANRKGKSQR